MTHNDLPANLMGFRELYFTNGFQWESPSHGTYLLVYVKRGEMRMTVSDVLYVAHAGEVLYVPNEAGKLNYHYAGTPYHGLTLGFRSFPNVEYYEYPTQVVKIDTTTQKAFEAIPCDIPICTEKLWKFYKALALLQPFLQPINQKHLNIVNTAMEYMNSHDRYDIALLAKLCCVSESGFRAIFQKVTGYTVVNMKHRLQAYKAEMLLNSTDLSIDEIARKVGFASTRHFRKIFKKRYSDTPNQIRLRRTISEPIRQLAPPPENERMLSNLK